MSTGDLLSIEPQELQFPFELRKQISCTLQLLNKTDDFVAFKVKTTNPKKYCVRPNTGIVLPRSTCDVIVTMQAQKEAPPDLQCRDKFLLQSVVTNPGTTPKDITPEMFSKESGHPVEECKLRVLYVPPPRPPSPVREGSEEGSSPRASISDNGNPNPSDFGVVSRAPAERFEPQDYSSELWLGFIKNMSALLFGETSPATYAPSGSAGDYLLKKTSNIFENLNSDNTAETPEISSEKTAGTNDLPVLGLQLLKWPMWLLGPSILLTTGMIPTLWLPISSIFLGPNIASLLSLIGLDCIFNLGATLFLLMADSCARPVLSKQTCNSKAPFSYQFWNMFATVTGFIIPLMMMLGSQKGFLQPLSSISFAVLLGPYLLLLSVQVLTEMLTWHWQSPVWLVTPVVYESYRLLQLMRGLKLGTELSAPAWMMHTIRVLVSWWVLVLGMQLMRVAWFAGFTGRRHQQHLSSDDD